MRRLIVTCTCGERIQVPRSALGRTGLCPACGEMIAITNDTATAESLRTPAPKPKTEPQKQNGPRETDVKLLFGQAVDLYFAQRYGESFAILAELARRFPDDPDI